MITAPVLTACRMTTMQQVVEQLTLMGLQWNIEALQIAMRRLSVATGVFTGLRRVGMMGRWALQRGGWGRDSRHDEEGSIFESLLMSVDLVVLSRVLSGCRARRVQQVTSRQQWLEKLLVAVPRVSKAVVA